MFTLNRISPILINSKYNFYNFKKTDKNYKQYES